MTHRSVRLDRRWKDACSDIDLQSEPSFHLIVNWSYILDSMYVPCHNVDIYGVAGDSEGDMACHD